MKIDARGLACPEPVIKTKAAIETSNPLSIQVIVDNSASQQNVQRYLESQGYLTNLDQQGNNYITLGSVDGLPNIKPDIEDSEFSDTKKIMVFCTTDRMGYGDDDLGQKLMISFIKTLKEMGDDLWRLVFVNNGVKLTIKDSPVIKELQAYEKNQSKILVCGTCLTHFNLLDKKKAGETTNMLDIVTSMQLADSVIKI